MRLAGQSYGLHPEMHRNLLRAVAHGHKAGILLRDLIPSNVLVANDEDGMRRAVLADFWPCATKGAALAHTQGKT